MPRKESKKLIERQRTILQILEGGCATTHMLAKQLQVSESAVGYAMSKLLKRGEVKKFTADGKIAVWCKNEEDLKKFVREVGKPIIEAVCGAHLRYITPSRVLRLLGRKKKMELLKYVPSIYSQRRENAPAPLALKFIEFILIHSGFKIAMQKGKKRLYYAGEVCSGPSVEYNETLKIRLRDGEEKYVVEGRGRVKVYVDDDGIWQVEIFEDPEMRKKLTEILKK